MTFSVPGYLVEHLLGYGSQAEVWAGQALDGGERVAIKRIATDSPAAARAARAEAALLAALDHPSLIGLRAYLVLGSEVAVVMELAEAGSLAELLRRRGRLSPAEVVATISPVAAALAHAHDEGVLHADVSATNILFTAAGQPKLADLGVARVFAGRSSSIGTPAYLDPVVAAGGAAGAASDVFALGAVALHALTRSGGLGRASAGNRGDRPDR
jgi:serine/threonine protein kinase